MTYCKKHESHYDKICPPCFAEFVERIEFENEKASLSFAETITKLAKERDLYNTRRKEAMVICEEYRNEKNKYKKALLEIGSIARGFLDSNEQIGKIEKILYKAFGGK